MIIFCSESLTLEQQTHCEKDLKAELVGGIPETEFYLEFSASKLLLKKNNSNEHGIFVDFKSDETKYHQQKISSKKDLLARAIGVEAGMSVCDLTLGLAGDAFKLCFFGAQVTGYEKNQNVWALVENATWRYQSSDQQQKPLQLKTFNDDCVNQLESLKTSHDVFYLDPMFDLARTALPRKGMQYLDYVTKPTPARDLETIFKHLSESKKKLIVKRAIQSDWLCGYKPRRSVEGKMVRFDVYEK